MIPGTRAGLEQAGYHKSGASKCKRCGAPIEWYQTPNGKKMPFEDVETEMLPHFSRCGKNGSAPPRAQVPPAEGYYQRSGEGTLQEVSELLRMASLKIDALLAKEKF